MGYYGSGSSAKSKDRRKDLFDTWSTWRKVQFWSVVLIIALSIVLFSIPMGAAVMFALFILPIVWKDPDDDSDPSNGMMVRGTRAYKIASFMSILKNKHRPHIYSPIVMLGFGPPERDIHKGLFPSMFRPPTRVSSYWALTLAIPLAFLEEFIQYVRFPIWDFSFQVPTLIMQIVSGIGFFMAFQVIWATRRFQTAIPIQGVDCTPAVMFNKLPKGEHAYAKIFTRGLVVGIISTAIFTFLLILASSQIDVDKTKIYIISALFGLSTALYSSLRSMVSKYREEFHFQCERRDSWNNTWAFKNALTPFFEMETPVPSLPGKPGGPPEGAKPEEDVHVWAATFSYPTNGTFWDYSDCAQQIMPSIPDAEMLTIAPLENKNSMTGKPIRGSVSRTAFRVWWTDQYIPMNELLDNREAYSPEQIEISVRSNVLEPLAKIRGIGRTLIHSHTLMTAPDSKVHIMRVNLIPQEGVTEVAFMKNISSIKNALGVTWVRTGSGQDRETGISYVELYIGDGKPDRKGVKFPEKAASLYRKKLFAVEWSYVFGVNKIESEAGKPNLMMSKPVTDVSTQLIFDLPPGVSMKSIQKAIEPLKTTSSNSYIEISSGAPDSKSLSRREQRELNKLTEAYNSGSQFTMVAATKHPLDRAFFFDNYRDKIITGREMGIAKTDFYTGVRADGSLAKYSFQGADPHLAIAGSSGSGKSMQIYSMLVQLCLNNYPEDVQINIVDPKVGFQNFQFLDNVTRYIDSWTPAPGIFFEAVRDMLKDLVDEMGRRNQKFRFADTEVSIDKLSVAREIGLKQGPLPDGSPNPLVEPYIFVILDEVAMLFAGAPDKETREIQDEIQYYASKLARESRSAGIHCLVSTQYPTKASLPTLIKQQSGRIGLKANDDMASRVIIDQKGLEDLFIKGSGKVKDKNGDYRDFRGFLFADPKTNEDNMMDYLKEVPRREPDFELDGLAARKIKEESEIDKYYDVPDVDQDITVFDQWDNSAGGEAYRSIISQGQSNTSFNKEIESLADMSDEEFSNLSLEEYKQLREEGRKKRKK